MELNTRTHGAWTVLAPTGRVDAHSSPELETTATSLVTGGVTSLALDLSGVPYMSSAGLRVLLGLHKRLKSAGGGFAVVAPVDTVREVLEISGFMALLLVVGSVDQLP